MEITAILHWRKKGLIPFSPPFVGWRTAEGRQVSRKEGAMPKSRAKPNLQNPKCLVSCSLCCQSSAIFWYPSRLPCAWHRVSPVQARILPHKGITRSSWLPPHTLLSTGSMSISQGCNSVPMLGLVRAGPVCCSASVGESKQLGECFVRKESNVHSLVVFILIQREDWRGKGGGVGPSVLASTSLQQLDKAAAVACRERMFSC